MKMITRPIAEMSPVDLIEATLQVKARTGTSFRVVMGEQLTLFHARISQGRPPLLPREIHSHPVPLVWHLDDYTRNRCSEPGAGCVWIDALAEGEEEGN